MRLRTVIVDDDNIFCDVMEHYISKVNWFDLAARYNSTEELFNSSQLKHIDLIFLDIEMPMMTGLEFLDTLSDKAPEVVIVSSKRKYGVDAFEYKVIDYLHKPFSFSRFMKTVTKVKNKFESEDRAYLNEDHFFIRTDGIWIKMPYDEVSFIRGDNNQVIIKTKQDKITSPVRLKDIEERLPKSRFMRVHRSYIVQLNKISKVDGEVVVVDDKTVPISKTYIKELYDRLNIER